MDRLSSTAVVSDRTGRLLRAPVANLLLRMAWPNVMLMLAQTAAGLVQVYWLGKLGSVALAGAALVFPAASLMPSIAAGALGGAVTSLIGRALGRGSLSEANELFTHALAVSLLLAVTFSVLFIAGGRTIYTLLGGRGAELEFAVRYSNSIFLGNIFIWSMNCLASIVRGTGEMLVPALATCAGTVLAIPMIPILIFGNAYFPALGVEGAGAAFILGYVIGTTILATYAASRHCLVKPAVGSIGWKHLRGIFSIGSLSTVNALLGTGVIAYGTMLVARHGSAIDLAGFGTAIRLEFIISSICFGIGSPIVSLVATNLGAGLPRRVRDVVLFGCLFSFGVSGAIGIFFAIWPHAWITLFSSDSAIVESGSAFLRIVGPFYCFLGLGSALLFVAQGLGRMHVPTTTAAMRMGFLAGGTAIALTRHGSVTPIYWIMAFAVAVFGLGTCLGMHPALRNMR